MKGWGWWYLEYEGQGHLLCRMWFWPLGYGAIINEFTWNYVEIWLLTKCMNDAVSFQWVPRYEVDL